MTEKEHLLTCLGEEGAEIAMDCSKCNRFGQHDINVLRPEGPDNIERLVNEMNDLLGVAKMLAHAGVIPENWESEAKQGAKIAKVLKFMKYAREKNALNMEETESNKPSYSPTKEGAFEHDEMSEYDRKEQAESFQALLIVLAAIAIFGLFGVFLWIATR